MPKGFKITVEDIKRRLIDAHHGVVSLKEETYINTQTPCVFVDRDFGEWKAIPNNVVRGKKNQHPERARLSKRVSIEDVRKRLRVVHDENVTLVDATYVDQTTLCEFVDCEYGRWLAKPYAVLQGSGHPRRGYKTIGDKRRIPLDEAVRKLREHCGDAITIVQSSYCGWLSPCEFNDHERGLFTSVPREVVRGRSGHPSRTAEKQIISQQRTALARYGVSHAMKHPLIQDKAARSSNRKIIKYHWCENVELICIGSYEVAVVEWLNAHQHDYEWQPGPFAMPDGRTYRPDVLITSGPFASNYIEIKGYFRDDAREKWEWFHGEHPHDSQLWDIKKLKEVGVLPSRRAKLAVDET